MSQKNMVLLYIYNVHMIILSTYPNTPHMFTYCDLYRLQFMLQVGVEVGQLNEPIYIMLRAGSGGIFSGSPRPAWWNSVTSEWHHDGCQLSDLFHGLLIFHCHRLGYFALLQDTEQLSLTSMRLVSLKHP